MAQVTVQTSSQDGYINDNGGVLTAFTTANDNSVSSSSSANTVANSTYFFFDTADATTGIPANAVIDSVTLGFQVRNSLPGGAGDEGLNGKVCNNACIGSTLTTADLYGVNQRIFNISTILSDGVKSYTLQTTDINRSGYTNVEWSFNNGDSAGGCSFTIDAQEKAGGTIPNLVIVYHVPGGSTLPLMGAG